MNRRNKTQPIIDAYANVWQRKLRGYTRKSTQLLAIKLIKLYNKLVKKIGEVYIKHRGE